MPLTTFITAQVVSAARLPTAAFVADPTFGVVGSVVRLDGRLSTDPDQKPLFYNWSFVSVPIGSQVQSEGFKTLDTDSDTSSPLQVSFSPDVVGEYVVGLTVSNGVFESTQVSSDITIRAILIPHGRGIIPDGKFIWSYIRDVWSQVDGKEFFETLWSALIQIVGGELLKLYQVDFNKSIRDIQDHYQRRWLSYEPKLLLDNIAHSPNPLSFYFGNHCAGSDAATINLGLEGKAIILAANEVIVVIGARLQNVSGETLTILYSISPGNVGSYELQGINATRNGYKLTSPDLDATADRIAAGVKWLFTIGSTNWEVQGSIGNTDVDFPVLYTRMAPLEDSLLPVFHHPGGGGGSVGLIQVGDVIHYPSGPNAGFYRILAKAGSFVTVDHAPQSAADDTSTATSNVYRPVGFKVTQPAVATTDTFSVPYTPGVNDISQVAPGRLAVVNGQTHTIVRSIVDNNQIVPLVVVTVDSPSLLAGLRNLSWRTPPTAISTSQAFEDLGVSTGDLLGIDVVLDSSGQISEVVGQVVGVSGNKFGFVFTDGEVKSGVIPPIPTKTIQKLATDFGIDGVFITQSGELVLSGTALAYSQSIQSGAFKKANWNQPLTPDSIISVNPDFQLKPAFILRNKRLPVDADLRSVPTLQEWIAQPTITQVDGQLFQTIRGQDFELDHLPVVLTENLEYLVDDEFAFVGQMTINTGSALLQVDDADFVDRSIEPGDSFIIDSPITLVGEYIIQEVHSNSEILLNRAVPAYVLGAFVTANVTLKRKRTGHFLRFVPGLFTAQKPAPARLWGEVSFFDNNQVIENNFGILVGLTRDTLESVSRDINYRQAVAGLMFAFTSGSEIDSVRLGAQILLGLPFAEHDGIVRSIETNYRLDASGNPILGRLLIEDIDSTGNPLGTLRIYLYPIDPASDLAGLDTNPDTGKPYAVGDTAKLFAPLSKGVEIIDYITNPLDANFSAIAQLQKYHAVRLRANDNIFSLDELSLVSDFLRKITPSYISFSLITASEFADVVTIQDLLPITISSGEGSIVDNASLSLPPTLMFDSKHVEGVTQGKVETGFVSLRRYGSDLVAHQGNWTFSSAAGGFVNPKANEVFQAPLVRVDAGDYLLILTGKSTGLYPISAVDNDTTIEVANTDPAMGFPAETGITFAIVRKVGVPVKMTANVISGQPTVQFREVGSSTPAQLRSVGAAPGDWVTFTNLPGHTGLAKKFKVISVQESTPTSGIWDQITVTPTPLFTTGSFLEAFIVRPALATTSPDISAFGQSNITADGSNVVVVNSPSVFTSFTAFLEPGDEILLSNASQSRLVVLDAKQYPNIKVTPALAAGTYDCRFLFKKHPDGAVGWDHIEKFDPIDEADISLVEDQSLAACVSTDIVTLQMQRTTAPTSGPSAFDPQADGVRPGDFLALTSGSNSTVDVGYGLGVYPIIAVTSAHVQLSVALTNTENDSWKIIRRR